MYVLLYLDVMSHSNILRPVHETSPPPLDDDDDVDENENEIISTIHNDELLSSTSPDVLNNSNDDWKSVDGGDDDDDNNDADNAQIQDDTSIINDENTATNIHTTHEENLQEEANDNGWANFATFESKPDEVSEVNI
jgi:hypothetical protein